MEGLTPHEAALAAGCSGTSEQARLIAATINVRTFLVTHPGMPLIGKPVGFSFPMPEGDDAKLDHLGSLAAWLNVEPENRNGTLWAYRDFDGLLFGGHFTPDHIRRERARQLFRGIEAAA